MARTKRTLRMSAEALAKVSAPKLLGVAVTHKTKKPNHTTKKPNANKQLPKKVVKEEPLLGPVPTYPRPIECPWFNTEDTPSRLANFNPEFTHIHSAFPASFWSPAWFKLVKKQHKYLLDYLTTKQKAKLAADKFTLKPKEISDLFEKSNDIKAKMDPVFRKHRSYFDAYLGWCEAYATMMICEARGDRLSK